MRELLNGKNTNDKKNESIKTDSCQSQFLALATLIQKTEEKKKKKLEHFAGPWGKKK